MRAEVWASGLRRRWTKEHDCLVFPSSKSGKPLSNMAMATVLRRVQVDATVHGFRPSFRDWAMETTPFLEGEAGRPR